MRVGAPCTWALLVGVAAPAGCAAPFAAGEGGIAADLSEAADTAGDPPSPDGSADTGGDPSSSDGVLVLYVAPDGDDHAVGTSREAALATLAGAHSRLLALDPKRAVDVRIAAGTYHCAGTVTPWTFNPGETVRIGPDEEVPGPAKEQADHPSRPVFEGRDADGELCADSVWLSVRHSGRPFPLRVEGLAVTRYRGAISVKADDGVEGDPDLGLAVENVVFQRIGDKYFHREYADGTWLEGKGAILLTRASGCTVADSWFDQVRNVEASAGLVHAIYFTSHASRNRVTGNVFHGVTGAIVKLTDASNGNTFLDNQLSYAPHGLRDRWCGALEDPDERCGGEPQCPSWHNVFPYERNTWGHLDHGDPVTVLDVPEGQSCGEPAPDDGVRMDLGEGGLVLGP